MCGSAAHTALLLHSEGAARRTPSTAQGTRQWVPVRAASDLNGAADSNGDADGAADDNRQSAGSYGANGMHAQIAIWASTPTLSRMHAEAELGLDVESATSVSAPSACHPWHAGGLDMTDVFSGTHWPMIIEAVHG